jgi:hypothetical protein
MVNVSRETREGAVAFAIKPNTIGLTRYDYTTWDGSIRRPETLLDQLRAAAIPHEVRSLADLRGWSGDAYLVWYTSPKHGRPVTVLVVPRAERRDWPAIYLQAKELIE